MTSTKQDVAEVLEKAANHVRTGWTQGQAFEKVGEQTYCCAEGALWLACGAQLGLQGADFWHTSFQGTLWANAIEELEEYIGDDLAAWNDSLGQTQDRVVDTMLALAKDLRNEAS